MVGTSFPCIVETNLFRDDTNISDLDNFMDRVSVGLAQYLHMEKLIDLVKLRFDNTVQISLNHTNSRHQKFTKQMIAVEWGIYDSKPEAKMESTTQMCVKLDILPFSRRYRTYLLSLGVRCLNMKIFTDTLFEYVKSLMNNKCA